MTQDSSTTADRAPEASDVVDGPVGSAHLKDPATSGPIGANLEALLTIDGAPGDQTHEEGAIDRPDLASARTRTAAPPTGK
jgi:hypothetical protein